MAKLSLKQGTTSKLVRFFAEKADGTGPFTGLLYNTSLLTAYYIREADAASTAITLVTGGTVGTFGAGTINPVDATNMPGVYELGLPNTALAAGKSTWIMIQGAANLSPIEIEIELTQTDNQSATAFMTAIGGVAPPANWNTMSVDGSGRILLQPAQAFANSTASTTTPSWYTAPGGAVASVTGDVGGKVLGGGASSFVANGVQTAAGGTPPTVTQIRQEMDTNSTKLANLDATVSSRSVFAGGAVASVTGNVGGDVSGKVLGNGASSFIANGVQVAAGGGSAPTVVQIRQEMDTNSTKLANLDAAVSTRSTYAGGAVASVTAPVSLVTGEENVIANALLDLVNGVETGLTVRQFFREMLAVNAGLSTENNGTVTFNRKDGTTVALTVVHSSTGSRIAVTPGTLT